jgi:hypothetical protein
MTNKQVYGAALALAIAGLMALSAKAAWPAYGDRMVYGAGMVTCAEWQQYRSAGRTVSLQDRDALQNRIGALQLQAWIDGFLAGYNLASQGPDFIAPKPESVAYYAWIDNYCSRNPLNKVVDGAEALKEELTTRARR